MRRYILGPVIACLVVIGLVGSDFGLLTQAQAGNGIKKEAATVASKDVKKKEQIKKAPQAVDSKKVASVKKKAKNRHASADGRKSIKKKSGNDRSLKAAKVKAGDKSLRSAKRHKKDPNSRITRNSKKTRHHASRKKSTRLTRHHVRPVSEMTTPSPLTSDLWLAMESPEMYRQYALENTKPNDLTKKILDSAYSCIGIPYRRGGTTPEGFDCSGFVRYIFRENGIRLGRSSRDQAQDGRPVQLTELRPGDLIFFKMRQRRKAPSRIDHVGLYLGEGRFIHASNNPRMHRIRVDDLHAEHYLPKVVGVRRVLDTEESQVGDTSSN